MRTHEFVVASPNGKFYSSDASVIMQDCYVGDLGDFGKYGLLRFLTANFKLGVVWYYVLPDAGNKINSQDGGHVEYLNLSPGVVRKYDLKPYTKKGEIKNKKHFESCDPELYKKLQQIVESGKRLVTGIERKGVLFSNTVFWGEELKSTGRRGWSDKATKKMAGVDIVF